MKKIAIFKEENALCFNFVCHKELRAAELGGDASENGDFQKRKQRLQGTKMFSGALMLYFQIFKRFRSSNFIATLHSKYIFWDSWDNIFNFANLTPQINFCFAQTHPKNPTEKALTCSGNLLHFLCRAGDLCTIWRRKQHKKKHKAKSRSNR